MSQNDVNTLVAELKNHLMNYDISGVFAYDGYFDEDLQSSLIDFQDHFGLETNGVADKVTFDALNTTINQKLDKIRINMERCRWISNLPPKNFCLSK